MTEARGSADFGNREISFDQHPFDFLDPHVANLFGGAAANQADEPLLQCPASNGEFADQVGHADFFVDARANQSQGITNHLVVDCQRIGRMTHYDSSWRK